MRTMGPLCARARSRRACAERPHATPPGPRAAARRNVGVALLTKDDAAADGAAHEAPPADRRAAGHGAAHRAQDGRCRVSASPRDARAPALRAQSQLTARTVRRQTQKSDQRYWSGFFALRATSLPDPSILIRPISEEPSNLRSQSHHFVKYSIRKWGDHRPLSSSAPASTRMDSPNRSG